MSTVTQFKCPNCSAELTFNPDKQNFGCEYCRGEFTEKQLLEFQKKMEEEEARLEQSEIKTPEVQTSATAEEEEEFAKGTNLYSCPSCGAEIVSDANTAATFCYYCHNPVILKGRVEGRFRPSDVLPFRLSKEKATEVFNNFAKKKWFIPRDLVSSKQIEKMTGLYVPFWVADADTNIDMSAVGKKVRTWTRGDTEYTETSRFRVERNVDIKYTGVPADGSQKIEDALMEAIEPFDYKDVKPFQMSYLSGFLADKYDVDKDKLYPRIEQRIKSNNESVVNSSVTGYTALEAKRTVNNVRSVSWKYMLLPVWFMTFKYKDRVWEYAINGQTGKVAGELPISKPKLLSFAGIIAAVVTVLGYIGGLLFR